MSTSCPEVRLENPGVADVHTDVPRNVSMEITGRCQLSCLHCFNESGTGRGSDLPLGTIQRVLDEMAAWNLGTIRITGGEPTVHRQFADVVAACRQRQISISLNTNGIYSAAMLEYLKSAPIERFFISLDGMRDNNDAIRGSGTFVRACQSCRELRDAGQRVSISFHAATDNLRDVSDIVALAAGLRVDVKISPLRPIGRAATTMQSSVLRPAEMYGLVRQLSALRRRFAEIDIRTDFDLLCDAGLPGVADYSGRASCGAGRTMLHITSRGEVLPCAFFWTPEGDFSAGSIFTAPLEELWQTAPVWTPFRTHQKSVVCRACKHYRSRCVGGCPAVAYFITGSLDARDPMCFLDPCTC